VLGLRVPLQGPLWFGEDSPDLGYHRHYPMDSDSPPTMATSLVATTVSAYWTDPVQHSEDHLDKSNDKCLLHHLDSASLVDLHLLFVLAIAYELSVILSA
jgi:hypothetical protein